MRRKKVPSPDFSKAWRAAGVQLADSGNRLVLIGALVILLPTALPYFMLSSVRDALILLLYEHSPASGALPIMLPYTLLLLLYTLLFVFPLIVGFFRMCHRTAQAQTVTLSDVFVCFEGRASYRHSLSLSFALVWRLALLTAVAVVTCDLLVQYLGNDVVASLVCGLAVLVEVLIGLALILRRFPIWAIALDRQISCTAARRTVKQIRRHARTGGILFFLNMVPRILLGLLTFGIFLIWEVLPRMCVAYFLYCNNLSENIDHQSEEYKNE